jgi:hypothetical protein
MQELGDVSFIFVLVEYIRLAFRLFGIVDVVVFFFSVEVNKNVKLTRLSDILIPVA